MLDVLHVPAFADNYIWLIRAPDSDKVAIVDPGDADPVQERLTVEGLEPVAILCTHHHGDHVGGVRELCAHFRTLPVYGPAGESITSVTDRLREGDRVILPELDLAFDVLDVPGHTAGHIAYVGHGAVFCGDTLFSAGCGRLFEGTAEQMHASLQKLAALPDDTWVYCAHEYTAANLRFAAVVEPNNTDIRDHAVAVARLQPAGRPTVPSPLALERRINPFLRSHVEAVRQAAEARTGQQLHSDVAVFAAVRRWKDEFRG